MRQFKVLMVSCVLALLCSSAGAQVSVVIDNKTIPTEHINSITILKNTNVISISTTVPYTVQQTVVGSEVAITSFTISPGSVEEGESATLSWTTENASACTASGGTGGWAGSAIGLPNGSKPITASTAGDYTFTLTCTGAVGDPAVRNASLTVTLANAVAITSFSANPTSIKEGESTTLSWVTANATSCTPTDGTAAWQSTAIGLPSGNTSISIATQGNYNFGLTCTGAVGGPVSQNVAVTVTEPNDCDPATLEGNIIEWQSFWGSAFPYPVSALVSTTILRDEYKAIRFQTGNVSDFGGIKGVETTLEPVVMRGAISECPGDFDVASICDQSWGLGGTLYWSTDGRDRTCQLEQNKTYYLNITFTDGVNPASTTCEGTSCRKGIEHRNW